MENSQKEESLNTEEKEFFAGAKAKETKISKDINDKDENESTINKKYTVSNFLDDVFMNENDYYDLRNLLETKMNIILQGSPGVGKTYMAKRLAYSIIGEKDEDKILSLQFHQKLYAW